MGKEDEHGLRGADAETAQGAETTDGAEASERFPVVGIGASAGGLGAFTEFLTATPDDTGMAFVLVQHLSPSRESLMAEILAKHTRMPCVQVEDRMAIEPDSVYVIPPDQYMDVADGVLRLTAPPDQRAIRTPIDFFFSSLAAVYGDQSIGVLLSGGGTDGTAGLRDIKAGGGLTIVQDPETAVHSSMPRHAVDTGLVDQVLPVSEIPRALVEYVNHPYVSGERESLDNEDGDPLSQVIALLRARSGFDFSDYKRSTLARRVERRMGLRRIDGAPDYVALLENDPQETAKLSRELLIGVSGFFRDPEAYEFLAEKVVPRLFEGKTTDSSLRVWVAGAATGEEAYSIGILLLEHMHEKGARCDVQLFATDVDQGALAVARTGTYPASAVAHISRERLSRFFTRQDDLHYRVTKELRDSAIFAPQNVLTDPPFSRLDLITCRNLMIYLLPKAQERLLDLFHFALRRNGYLFLGSAESVSSRKDLFETLSGKWRIFRSVGGERLHDLEFPAGSLYGAPAGLQRRASKPGSDREQNLAEQMQRILVAEFAPACVLINQRLEVLYSHGPVEDYLDWPVGEPTRNLLDVLVKRLRRRVRGGIARAVREEQTIVQAPVPTGKNREDGAVRVATRPVDAPEGADDYFLVTFEQVPRPARSEEEEPDGPGAELQEMAEQLRTTREDLQSTIQELEAANEELKASNEEVMSMNEELQSTNEELETSKEELQSLNEELTAVNAQLEEKVAELQETGDDLNNLLRGTDIATVFLDPQMRVRRFTPAATRVFRLIASDAGRPIGDVAWEVEDPSLIDDARRVLEKLVPVRAEVPSTAGDRWYARRVLPYRTADDRIEGVVVTYVDVTARKRAEILMREQEEELRVALEGAEMGTWNRDLITDETRWSPRLYELLGRDPNDDQITGETFFSYIHEDDLPRVRASLKKVLSDGGAFRDEFRIIREDGEVRWMASAGRVVRDADGQPVRMSGVNFDVTERKLLEQSQRDHRSLLEQRVNQRTEQVRRRNRELRELAGQLSMAEQRERERIADVLHDDLQQILAYGKLRAHDLPAESGNEQARRAVADVRAAFADAITRCRDLSHDLLPVVHAGTGLADALKGLAEHAEQRFELQVSVDVKCSREPDVPEELAVFLLRSVSELLFNCAKHAATDSAQLTLECEGDRLTVAVADGGAGFAPRHLTVRGGDKPSFGLSTIDQRARFLGGTFSIESAPGEGSRFVIRLPADGV